jgi:hypothetical protein
MKSLAGVPRLKSKAFVQDIESQVSSTSSFKQYSRHELRCSLVQAKNTPTQTS